MFLKKFTVIKSVGKFKSGGIKGGEYAKYTLFYGGNGRGKTTLCAILRSLRDNLPTEITRRQTFGSIIPPEVQILSDNGPIKFIEGAWSQINSNIHIFDQPFINENVHAGTAINLEQRRNFYRVVVGTEGVRLAREIDTLDEQVTRIQALIKAEGKALQQHVPTGMALEAFLKLPANSNIDAEITKVTQALKAINSADAIIKRPNLIIPALPEFPLDFETRLAEGLDEVSAEAASLINTHIHQHEFHNDGQTWLAKGTAHIRDEKCPFCSASIAGNTLVTAYRGYFSEAYKSHKDALNIFSDNINALFGEAAAIQLQSQFKSAASEAEFWQDYCDHGYATPAETNDIINSLAILHTLSRVLVDKKINAPLDNVAAGDDFQTALSAWNVVKSTLEPACSQMKEANILIEAVKQQNAVANKVESEMKLAALQAIRKRHSSPFIELALNYANLLAQKEDAVASKDSKKHELDTYDSKIFGSYESKINVILKRFNAGFTLSKSHKNYQGKIPQSTYCLRFGSSDLDIAKSKPNEPTFETTMSAGDKSTFALAFFLTQIERDPDLSQKIVIFDDPFTSLDEFRREMTAKAIVKIGKSASQVIILSHDKYFLDAVRQKIHGAQWASMQIVSTSDNSTIQSWDIEREVKEGYLKNHMALLEFSIGQSGQAGDIIKIMRPLLETYIRYRFPNSIQTNHWLGDMIGVIREDNEHPLKPQLQELDDINDYTKTFHHDSNAAFNDDEVLAHAKRTLNIVGGC